MQSEIAKMHEVSNDTSLTQTITVQYELRPVKIGHSRFHLAGLAMALAFGIPLSKKSELFWLPKSFLVCVFQ